MAETPIDIIMKHLTLARRAREEDNFDKPDADVAIAIDKELKQEFRFYAPAAPWETDRELLARNSTVKKDLYDGAPVIPIGAVGRPEGTVEVTVRLSGNPMLWYMGTDKLAYRLDLMNPGDSFPLRERQIALALTDLSANALRDQTL